ncbi:acyl carrier protein [Streptomyces afghaniensis]|uniref:acyl carrier protein n=1 Tax=Streptomyces afghaniensis TaxID=66865 RepID=UPI0027D87E11|nr:acyl carrier protein [Streptomyces afghaniensis]
MNHTPDKPAPALRRLSDLPRPERRDALEELVTKEFRSALLMTDDEALPADQSFFDLGLTSLSVTGLKQRLEGLLGVELDANLLFNRPTVEALLEHLTQDLLPGLFRESAVRAPVPPAAPARTLLDAALKDLFQG